MSIDDLPVENLSDDRILVVGGGPVGLVFALVLAHHGVRSVLLERNVETTRFPKMDLTLARTMEIFRHLGFADEIRAEGVSSSEPFTVRFSSGLGAENTLTSWDMPSVDGFRERIASNNDGSMPLEPWQRIPGDVMERWLRAKCESSPLVDARYGWTITGAEEQDEGVEITVLAPDTTTQKKIRCGYAVGCEGASSVLRKSLGIAIDGGPLTSAATLIHFKSRDLQRIQRQGSFWHTFFPSDPSMMGKSLGGAIIAQDAKEVWTCHEYLTPGYEPDEQNAKEAIMRVLGGMGKPYQIEIDEIIVQSTFKPTVALAEAWSGKKQRIFLAGDSCHQTVPSGGYGMNLGLADAWDLGWKLAAKIQGWGGPNLLASYEVERRPVAELMQHWGKVHGMKLLGLPMAVKMDPTIIDSPDEKGQALRKTIHDYIQTNNDHNQSFGVELGYRYESSICVPGPLDEALPPPTFNNRAYIPTTYPGYRSPHVFLKDGSAIFDHYGSGFTLVTFADTDNDESTNSASAIFEAAAKQNNFPLKVVSLVGETNASQIWGAKLVVVRPDGHVSWRANSLESPKNASQVLLQASGHDI